MALRTAALLGIPLLAVVAAGESPELPAAPAAVSPRRILASPSAKVEGVADPDPDARLRARRAAKAAALEFLRASAPAGTVLIPGRIEFRGDELVCEGGFYLGVREVTSGEFRGYLAATGVRSSARLDTDDAIPVVDVTQEEARAFAAWRGCRLPTRAEMEAASTVRGRCRYPWGDAFDAGRANTREAGLDRLLRVASRSGGVSVHGCDDLVGNAAEWTDTASGSGGRRLYEVVGGSYRKIGRRAPFVTYRLEARARCRDVGFRIAASLPRLR